MNESALPRILNHPKAGPVPSGTTVPLSVVAYRATRWQWYHDGQRLEGKVSSTISIPATAENLGKYVVKLSNQYGDTFSEAAEIRLLTTSTKPTISGVSPRSFEGKPLGQKQTITITGSGFLPTSTLMFYEGSTPRPPLGPPRYFSQNELKYDIGTGSSAGEWKAIVINAGVESDPFYFWVIAAPDITAPPAPIDLRATSSDWSRNSQVLVDWTNPADASGIAKAWVKVGSPPTSPTDGVAVPVPANKPLLVNVPVTSGTRTIYVWLEDGAGNRDSASANRSSLTLGADSTSPIVQISSPAANPLPTTQNPLVLTGSYSDNLSGVTSLKWHNFSTSTSGDATKTGTSLSGSWSTPTIALTPGLNLIGITATDSAGNVGAASLLITYATLSNSGTLGVGIQPQGAVDAGAQWRLFGESAWRTPGAAVSGIATGSRVVEFKAVDGWITPLPATVNVLANLTVILSPSLGTYGSGTVIQAPDLPSNPYPLDGAVNIPRSGFTLTWSGGHPTGSPDFAVAFGTVNPPPFIAGFGSVPGRTYNPTTIEPLLPATTYYWRVSGKVGEQRTDGPVWRFTTDYSYADLIPYEIAVDGNIQPGADVTVRVKVKNQGTFTSAAGCWLNLYLSQTPQGRERRISQFNTLLVPALIPGAEVELQQTVKLDHLPAGQSFIDAWVDSARSGINEKDYENNVRSLAIQYVDGQSPVVTSARLLIPFAKTGQSNSIIYFATDDVGIKTMDFYYSVSGGVNWTPIQEGHVPPVPPVNGVILPWTIPTSLPLDTNLLVRVVARDASGNWGETNTIRYVIYNGTAPTVTVLSPNGGEVWDMNSTQTIRWSVLSPNPIIEMKLWFRSEDGNSLSIADITTNTTGQFSWTLPNNFVAPKGRIWIYVRDNARNESEDYSDGDFSIRDTSAPPPAPWTSPQNVGTGGSPRIATDASGNVHLVYLTRSETGTEPITITQNILYRKKVGANWSAPSTVYSSVQQLTRNGPPGFNIVGLQIAVDTSATPHVVWRQEYRRSSSSDFNWENHYSDLNLADVYYSALNGVQWTPPANVSANLPGVDGRSTSSGYPSLKTDSSNTVHIVWADGRTFNSDGSFSGTMNIYYRTLAQAWFVISQLTTEGGSSPSLEVDSENSLHMMYSKGYPQNGYYTKWNGSNWSPPTFTFTNWNSLSVSFSIGTSNQPSMVWYDYNEVLQNQKIYFSCFDGTQWASQEVISGNLTGARNAIVKSDSHGRPHAVFAEVHSANNRLYQQLFYTHKSQTVWTTPYILHFQSENVEESSIDSAISSNDEMHVVWTVANGTGIYYNHANVGSTNDLFSPSVSVSPPYSGQELAAESAFNIRWQATDDTGVTAVHLHYATNGGSSWTLIATNQANSGIFAWTVPALGTNVGQIRVTARDAAGNAGVGFSGSFTTADLTPPVITINSPTNSATLVGGNQVNVNWIATDNIGVTRIDLEYSLDNGASWADLATNLANTGTQPWNVPTIATATLLVRATARDAAGYAASYTTQPLSIIRANIPPLAPHSPFPLLSGAGVPFHSPLFQWLSVDLDGDFLTYQIRLGTNTNTWVTLTLGQASFAPGMLRPGMTYYWQVLVTDGQATNAGPIWTFTTEAGPVPPVTLPSFARTTNGHFGFEINAIFGENYAVQGSTNLVDWITLTNFTTTNYVLEFLDSAATNYSRRFYRVISP